MLFQEHGGQNDKDRQQIRGILDLPVFLQGLAVPDGNTDSDRVEYVDARQHVRGRIGSVNMSYQVYEYILPFKCNRTQVQPVGENRAQEQEERHPGDQERTQAVKAPLVGEEKISGRCGDKYEPQQSVNESENNGHPSVFPDKQTMAYRSGHTVIPMHGGSL